MCCGQKVHHDAIAMLTQKINASIIQRPTPTYATPIAINNIENKHKIASLQNEIKQKRINLTQKYKHDQKF